ncbi:MAG: hypothetical protein ACYC6O_04665 [Thermoleophilia bacterium]
MKRANLSNAKTRLGSTGIQHYQENRSCQRYENPFAETTRLEVKPAVSLLRECLSVWRHNGLLPNSFKPVSAKIHSFRPWVGNFTTQTVSVQQLKLTLPACLFLLANHAMMIVMLQTR